MKPTTLIWLFIAVFLQSGKAEDKQENVTIFVNNYDTKTLVTLESNGSHTEETVTSTAGNPMGMHYDSVEKQIYWGERLPFSIRRSDINRENVTVIASLPSSVYPYGLTIDEDSRRLFYTNWPKDEIVSMDLTGANPTTIHNSTTVESAFQIIIHKTDRRIIYSEDGVGGSDGMISSCNFDGSNIKRIVTTSSRSFGLAVDEGDDIVYWSEFDTGLIRSIAMDGSNMREIYRNTSMKLRDVFLLDTTLYFTAQNYRRQCG